MRTLLIMLFLASFTLPVWSIEIGEKAPQFKLKGHDGKTYELEKFKGKFVVLEWFNEGCPFVRKHYDSQNMQKLQKQYTAKNNVVWLSIVSSVKGKQGFLADESEAKKTYEKEVSRATALLLDHSGKVGSSYSAVTTPHMYLIGPEGKLLYQGAIDSIPSANREDIKKATNYIQSALEMALAGEPIKVAKTKPYGCSVKY